MNSCDCIRCGEAPSVTELGYCSHCHWAVQAEVADGFTQLRAYLLHWNEFRVWEREHGGVPA